MACISREKAYEVLGLVGEDEKTEVEIKTAYRQRSLATHPDKNAVRSWVDGTLLRLGIFRVPLPCSFPASLSSCCGTAVWGLHISLR